MAIENDSSELPDKKKRRRSKQRSLVFKIVTVTLSVCLTILLLVAMPETRAILKQELRVLSRHAKVWYQDSLADLFAKGDLEAVHQQFLTEAWPPGSVTYCPDSGYTIMPGFSGAMYCENVTKFRNYPLHFHVAGYRVDEDADQKLFRKGGILTTGCSFTFGDEIAGRDTYSCVAASELWGDAGAMAAYNFGVCQSGYPEMIHRLERLERTGILEALEPQCLVVGSIADLARRSFLTQFSAQGLGSAGKSYISRSTVGFTLNHFQDELDPTEVFEFREKFFGNKSDYPNSIDDRIALYPFSERQELIRSMSPVVHSTTEAYRAEAEASDREFYKTVGRKIANDMDQHSGLQFYEFVLGKFVEIANRNGIKDIVVMWLPQNGDGTGTQKKLTQQAVRRLAESGADITFVDGWSVIENHPNWSSAHEESGDPYGRGRTHPGASGLLATVWNCRHPDEDSHRLYGQQLADTLRHLNLNEPSRTVFSAPPLDPSDPLFLRSRFEQHVAETLPD